MTQPTDPHIRVVTSLSDVDRAAWDACANPGWPCDRPLESVADPCFPANGLGANGDGRSAVRPPRRAYNPFVTHDFLSSLEESGSATIDTGWLGQHLVLEDADGIHGVAPCYLKNHSQGEYVFDYGWADAFERAGGRYYPKLQLSVPFTPVTGPRLLVGAEGDGAGKRRILAAGIEQLTRKIGASSAHITFLPHDEWAEFEESDYLLRTDQQFHWENDGYRSFDDFLAALSSRKRKTIRRERRAAQTEDVAVEWVSGSDITEAHWDAFFDFYIDTGARKWGHPYLNREFFSLIGERMADRILLILAKSEGVHVAGALNLIGSETLYGRYWGCVETRRFLHFEICYYQAIEWAIAHGLRRVEAGAQGPHKLSRGYLPTITYSAHYVANRSFRDAVSDYLNRERRMVAYEAEMLGEHSPFRRLDGGRVAGA